MGLIGRLREWALARPRVLVAAAAGTDSLRWAAESELDRRGWVLAQSPSDADLLLVLGVPGPQLSAAVDLVWGQIPQPRCRVEAIDESRLAGQLDTALRALVLSAGRPQTTAPQRAHQDREESANVPMGHGGHGEGGHEQLEAMSGATDGGADRAGHDAPDHFSRAGAEPGHEDMDSSPPRRMDAAVHEAQGHTSHEHMGHAARGGSDHAAHEAMGHARHGRGTPQASDAAEPAAGDGSEHSEGSGHEAMSHAAHGGDHAGHQMHHGGTVAGLDMAGTAPDRDGLQLDLLGVSLGPVLPGWPTGLLLQARLQGDVVTEARLSWVDGSGRTVRPPAAVDSQRVGLDHLAVFLWVAGWSRAARDARWARDGLGSTDPAARALAAERAVKVARRVRRSRSLAWMVRGTGRPAAGAGDDVLDRISRWCAIAAGEEAEGIPLTPLDELAAAVTGAELGAVRLIVASVELDRAAPRHDGELAHA